MSDADDFFDEIRTGVVEEDDVPRDGMRRYYLPDMQTGEVKGRTRVTTVAGTMENGFGLTRWREELVVRGMGLREDLRSRAGAADPEDPGYRKLMKSIADAAFEAAGGSVGSNLGTAQHTVLHRYFSKNEPFENIAEYFHADIKAVEAELARKKIKIIPRYCERVVYCSLYDRGGKIDGIAELDDGTFAIIDWKTEKDPTAYPNGKTVQCAFYSNADGIMNYDTQQYEPMPPVRRDIAIVVHCRPGSGEAKALRVPIDIGWVGARLAEENRAFNKQKIVISEYFPRTGLAPAVVSQPTVPITTNNQGTLNQATPSIEPTQHPGCSECGAYIALGHQHVDGCSQRLPTNGVSNSTQIKEMIDQQIQSGQQIGLEQVTQLNRQAAVIAARPFVPNSNPALAVAGLPQGPAQPPGLPVPPGPQPPGISKNASPAELLADFLGRTGKGIEPDVFYEEMIAELAELTKPQLQDMLRLIQPGIDEGSLKKHRKPLAERLTGLIKQQHEMRGRGEPKQPELPYEITAVEQGAPEEIPLVEPVQTAPWSQPSIANDLIDMSFAAVMRAIDEAPNMDRLGAIYQQWVGTYGPQGWVGQILDAANAKMTQLQPVPTH